MLRRAHRLLLRLFGALPRRVRVALVHAAMPGFTVGAVCVVERGGGELLLVRNSYRPGWGFPGGLLNRGEAPEAAALRELEEETGLPAELVGEPAVVVDADSRRVDVVFRARPLGPAAPAPGADVADAAGTRPRSAEILEVGWFPPGGLPALQSEARDALVALARSTRPLASPPLLDGSPAPPPARRSRSVRPLRYRRGSGR